MSITNTLTQAVDTYVREDKAGENFGDRAALIVRSGGGNERFSYLGFAGLPSPAVTVLDAELRVYLGAGWSGGPHTMTAKRITASWKELKLTWNSKPAVTATHSATAAVTGGSDGDLVIFDVTTLIADAVAAGIFYGIRLEVDTTGTDRKLHSSEAVDPDLRAVLVIVYSSIPTGATDLKPSGNQQVSIAKPMLSWRFLDVDGDLQAELQVQIDDAADFATPVFDSGWVIDSKPQLDLATTAYGGITNGQTRYWRVRTKDSDGEISEWSDAAQFGRTDKGTFELIAPTGDVEETTPPVTSKLTGQAQKEIQYLLEEEQTDGTWLTVWDSGRFAAAVASATNYTTNVPQAAIRKQSNDYRLTVRSFDGVDRIATPGDPLYVQVQLTFQWVAAASPPTAPTGLTATTEAGSGPGVALQWSRSSAPDYWMLLVDGVAIFDRIPGPDLLVSGTTYAYTHYGATAHEEHTYAIKAVVDSGGVLKTSASASVDATIDMKGIWLIDDQVSPVEKVRIIGRDQPDFALGESSATYYPVGRQDPVRITDVIRGVETTIGGILQGSADRDTFLAMKSRVGRTFRLSMADLNIPVRLGDAKEGPMPRVGFYLVTVDVYQVDEFVISQ